jgi:CheY-like chemotaxis protein
MPTLTMTPQKPLVLILEDNEADAYIITRTIEQSGLDATVTLAPDLHAAQAHLETACLEPHCIPTLVIVDIGLPDGRGSQLVKWAREHPLMAGVRFVAISSHDDEASINEAYAAGIHSFVTKHDAFTTSALAATAHYWLVINEPITRD